MSSLLATGPIAYAKIAATGTHAVAAAVSGKKRRLIALAAFAGAAGCTFYLASGSTALTGTMTIGANGAVSWPGCATGYIETAAGEALNVVVTAGALNGAAVVQSVI